MQESVVEVREVGDRELLRQTVGRAEGRVDVSETDEPHAISSSARLAPHGRVVGPVGEVIAFEELVRMRRRRVALAVHARCRLILADSVAAARDGLVTASTAERPVRLARLRKLEELEEYASALG